MGRIVSDETKGKIRARLRAAKLTDPKRELAGPNVSIGPLAAGNDEGDEEQRFAKQLQEPFRDADWPQPDANAKLGAAATDLRDLGLEGRWDGAGILYQEWDQPADPKQRERFHKGRAAVRDILPMLGQHCSIVHNRSTDNSTTTIGAIIVGRPKEPGEADCGDIGYQQ